MSFLLAGLSGLVWGVADFVGGLASRKARPALVVLWGQVAGLAALALVVGFFGGGLTPGAIVWGAAAGFGGSVGLICLYTGFARARVAVVAPISGVISALLPVMTGVALGERPSIAAWVGIGLAIPAIWLVSRGSDRSWGVAGLGYGIGAGFGFGLFFIFIAQVPAGSGMWSLIPARLAGMALLAALVMVKGGGFSIGREVRPGAIVSGIGDITANVLFLLASRLGLLSLTAVLSSLYPVVSVILARAVLHERIGAGQWVGVGLATASVAAIAG